MSREIKFRAWRKGSMTYNHSFNINIAGQIYFLDESGEWQIDEDSEVTLMQFTGHQVNGVDVYECDIIRLEENDDGADPEDRMTWYVVTWIKEWCMFALLRAEDEYREYLADGAQELDTTMFWTFPLELSDTECSKHYLCGNIYENPELLKP